MGQLLQKERALQAMQSESPRFLKKEDFFSQRGGGILLGLARYHRHMEWLSNRKKAFRPDVKKRANSSRKGKAI